MSSKGPQIVICFLVVGTILLIYGITSVFNFEKPVNPDPDSFKTTWIYRLFLNLIGYATIFLPGYLVFKYVRLSNFVERSGGGILSKLVEICFVGRDGAVSDLSSESPVRSLREDSLRLMFCFIGLQGSYLTWGILQEKVMTQAYVNNAGEVGHFKDSQFLVFVNRILAFSVSGCYIFMTRLPRHSMPLYKYAYCSFSNIMSSWCQYEALKFVSFPSQVLAKACKLIPVMIMGKIVSRQKYEYYEYVTAFLISIGMTFFMLSSAHKKDETVTTLSGVILLAGYMTFDSFTSNWQGALFNQYKMRPIQMMCGVNFFSCLFTATSLIQQGALFDSLSFMLNFPKFAIDCILISISSGAGQLFVFSTIAWYGPIVFVIIMTIRQALAILLSCLIYNHSLSALGFFGIVLVFVAIFLRIYCNQRLKALKNRLQLPSASKV